MQPFAAPHGDYFEKIFKPAIEKTGLKPVRADADIFGTGKIIDQIWRGINNAKVLVAELTTRNANVLYELGLAHALKKPVVLVSSNQADVPFDLHHIRVIYYDVTDPFWGTKLIDKVAENILSALKNPEEAIFKTLDESASQ
jgi:nucleoside 2-deoxyribosyltransferase